MAKIPTATHIALSSVGNLSRLTRALRRKKGRERWRRLKGDSRRYRLRCTKCFRAAFEIINEPVVRKRHTMASHRRRTVAKCLIDGTIVNVTYGGVAWQPE